MRVIGQHNYIALDDLQAAESGYVAVGAKADGLYIRTHESVSRRLLTSADVGATVAAFAHTHAGYEPALGNPAGEGYVLSSSRLGVRSWVPQTADFSHFYFGIDSSLYSIYNYESESYRGIDLIPGDGISLQQSSMSNGCLGVRITALALPHELSPANNTVTGLTAGRLLRATGSTIYGWSTATYPNTITAKYILFATAANVLGSSSKFTFDDSTGALSLLAGTTAVAPSLTLQSYGATPANVLITMKATPSGNQTLYRHVIARIDITGKVNADYVGAYFSATAQENWTTSSSAISLLLTTAGKAGSTRDASITLTGGSASAYPEIGAYTGLLQVTAPANASATALLKLVRSDTSTYNGYLGFEGTAGAGGAYNLSSDTSLANRTLSGFIKIIVNGAVRWIPYYTYSNPGL